MKKTAILIDAELFRIGLQRALRNQLGHAGVTADVMYRNAVFDPEQVLPWERSLAHEYALQATDFRMHRRCRASG